MQTPFQLTNARIAATVAAILFEIALPLVLAIVARRRLGVGWRYFGYGALIFFLFQMISRVPLVQVLQTLLAPQLRESFALRAAWVTVLALTAGLFEEVGRYVGYRWLMRREEKTWSKAVMYGLGHGGLESMVLIAGRLPDLSPSRGGPIANHPDQAASRAVARRKKSPRSAQSELSTMFKRSTLCTSPGYR
jgi:uncharacterized membrane protein YhfC